jgi:hypothetical protein
MLKVLAVGGFDEDNPEEANRFKRLAEALGRAVIEHNHTLLNGCRTAFDAAIADAAHATAVASELEASDQRIISYVLSGQEPVHAFGTVLRSRLKNWEIGGEARLRIPETIQQADVIVLVGGFHGTNRAANWARIARKPLLPLASLGGAAAEIFQEELSDFDRKYASALDRLEFEQLNSVKVDVGDHASDIVALAEKVAGSHTALVIMSYELRSDLKDLYGTFRRVVESPKFAYKCRRVNEESSKGRILPEILERIEHSAFIIADLTDLRPNVFYELGYADGLGKTIIATAKKGTELPFDVKDIPTIFWDSYEELSEDLATKIEDVVNPAVSSASPPIGPD